MSDHNPPRGFSERPAAIRPKAAGADPRMREVQSSEAKTHLPQLLDEVERGATIVITRHGRPIARLVPEGERRRRDIAEAIETMKKLAKERAERFGTMTVDEILSLRHEGHKY